MKKPSVFVSRVLPNKGLEMIHQVAEAEVWPEETPPPYKVLLEKVRRMDGLVCLLTDRIDAALMDAATDSLQVISQMAVGVDNIDLPAATARGIPVGHTPGVLTETTADFAFALLLAAARRVVEGERYVKAGRWKTWGPTLLMGYDLHGATLGILGFGRIGQALAKRASGFDMRVLFYDPSADGDIGRAFDAEKHTLDYVLAEADVVSLHVPHIRDPPSDRPTGIGHNETHGSARKHLARTNGGPTCPLSCSQPGRDRVRSLRCDGTRTHPTGRSAVGA